ncbi:MAG: hypothetical protein ABIH50_00575 [bacterium]
MKKDNSLFSIINISVKKPISEETAAALIRSGLLKAEYYAHIFAFFTELPLSTILSFIKKHKLTALQTLNYYKKNVRKYYRNLMFEEYFKYAK